MQRWFLALAAAGLASGCLGPGAPSAGDSSQSGEERADSMTSGSTTFLLAQESFWINATGDRSLFGDVGPHCPDVSYQKAPPSLVLFQAHEHPVATGVLVRQFDAESLRSPRLARLGEGVKRYDFPDEPGSVRLESPFEPGRTLAIVEANDGAIQIDGAPVKRDGPWTGRFEYDVEREGQTYHVTERIEVLHLGRVDPSVRNAVQPCD